VIATAASSWAARMAPTQCAGDLCGAAHERNIGLLIPAVDSVAWAGQYLGLLDAVELLHLIFFQAEVGIREYKVTGVQTCALPIYTPAPQVEGMDYVIVRCEGAGVFAGYLKERKGEEATILRARRLWYWSGAASLSQLAVDGKIGRASCRERV